MESDVLDRDHQRHMLEVMKRAYPLRVPHLGRFTLTPEDWPELEKELLATVLYLEEHGLCESGITHLYEHPLHQSGFSYSNAGAKITAKGLDFLEQDGGLTAILGVVTVRLEADTIRALLAARIEASPLPPEEKSALRKQIEALPGMAMKELASRLVKKGVDAITDPATWSQILGGII